MSDWSHEQSYAGISPAAWLHRARLRSVLRAVRALELGPGGKLADFGCSNGFVLERLRALGTSRGVSEGWSLYGFDWSHALLEQAERKRIPGCHFERFDLNAADAVARGDWTGAFDAVLCFETLEHTGSYRNALHNLCSACAPGGVLLIAVPNEVGVPGLIKYAGRRLLRRRPYGDFFREHDERAYLAALLRGGDIERFRSPPRDGWGPHLGFDYRCFEAHLDAELVRPGLLALESKRSLAFGFGRLYRLRKRAS